MTGFLTETLRDFFQNTVLEFFYFPIWWYSRGLKKTAGFCWRQTEAGWRASGLWSFIRNFFRPMYGATGWDAYVLTLLVRIWQMLWRSFLLCTWSLILACFLLVWLILPIFLIWQLIF